MDKYKKDEEKIIELYSSGLSLEEVSNQIGCGTTRIYKIIKKHGVSRSKKEAAEISKKLKKWNQSRKLFDEHIFDKISYKEAYFLGFLFADGCVCNTTGNRNIITITSKDKEVIDIFLNFFDSKNKIYIRNINENISYVFSVSSKYLFNKLISLGCIEKKSLIIGVPNIEEKYYSAFLLGLFDGDGCISLHKRNNSWKCSICTASINMKNFICSFIEKYYIAYHVDFRKIKSGNFYNVSMIGISAKYFLSILYRNLNYGIKPLMRKYHKYKILENIDFRKGPNFQHWEKEIINKFFNNEIVIKMINNDFRNYGWERSKDTIRHLRKNL